MNTPAPVAPKSPKTSQHAQEVARGERFEFGQNWTSFLRTIDEQRIVVAADALCQMLGTTSLAGQSFLDAGSGSGLFSLAAHRLGADVLSFDFDPESVACTRELRTRFAGGSTSWQIMDGSVLDLEFLEGLGAFDVVYSWGVLHHTGHMWDALEAVIGKVKPGGRLFIAIYNDQGAWSRRWQRIKKLYCSGLPGRLLTTTTIIPFWIARDFIADIFWQRAPWTRYREYRQRRGMSVMHDWIDWLGGYPFEFAKPEAIVEFYLTRGFTLERLRTVGGAVGCNEYVLRRGVPREL